MSEWISVKDRLPDPDIDNDPGYSVFVLITNGTEIGLGSYEYEYYAENETDPLQYSSPHWYDATHHIEEPTHWMPLPEPPHE